MPEAGLAVSERTCDCVNRRGLDFPLSGQRTERRGVERGFAGARRVHTADRRFAIAKAATYIDPARPQWLPKTSFFMLMRDKALAQLHTHFEESAGTLTIRKGGEVLAQGSLVETSGRASIDAFFRRFLNDAPGAPGRLVEAPGHSFSDASRKPGSTTLKYLSLLNLASIRELEKVVKVKIDPIRFRAKFPFGRSPRLGRTRMGWEGNQDWHGSSSGFVADDPMCGDQRQPRYR